MLESERQFKPKVVGATGAKDTFDYWLVDGRVIPRNNVGRDLPVAAREMSDLTVRIKHMDELGIDCQVIYPTFFITPVSRRPDIDLAVARSYNAGGRYRKKAPDRFRWVLVPPLQEHGASRRRAQFGRRTAPGRLHARSGSRTQSQRPLFYPLYEQASALDLRSGHYANGAFTPTTFRRRPGFSKFK